MNILKNKKGQFLLGAGALAVIGVFVLLIIIGIFIFTSINKFAIIGGGLIALVLIFGFRGQFNKTKAWFMGVIIVVGLIFVLASGTLQSVLSVSQVQTSVEGGKVYWTVFASANNIDEQFDFVRKFDKYTYSDGTTVTPKKSMAVLVTEKDSSCEYSLIDLGGGIKGLSVPSKNIDILVLDGNSGNSQILEGEKADSVILTDSDGKGKLIVSSEGLLGGANECPDYENVAIIEQDGQLVPVYKDSVIAGRTACGTSFFSYACLKSLFSDQPVNNQFTSAFDSYTLTSTKFIGKGLNLGSATFTIKADQDYFDSVVYTPPKECEPVITSINLADSITQGTSSSLKVNLKNSGESSCKVTISPSGDDMSFSPNSRDVTLSDSTSTSFIVSNGNSIGNKKINVEACFVGFSGKICDSSSVTFNSISKEEETPEYCGDKKCQDFESYTTCPSDCEKPVESEGLECKSYEVVRYENDVIKSWYNYLGVGEPTVVSNQVCVTATWIYFVIGSFVVLVLGIVAMITFRPKKRKKRK